MSKVLLTETYNVKLQLVEGAQNGRMIAKGQFGKADIPTANRRIYPRAIWDREIGKLLPKMKNNEVYGELDHPCQISPAFEVLTSTGWKWFFDLTLKDQVWSRVNGEAVLSDVLDIIDRPYDGLAYKVKGRNIDSGFTPNHKFVLIKRPDEKKKTEEVYVTIDEIAANPSRFGHHAIPKTAVWNKKTEYIVIPGVKDIAVGNTRNDVTQDLVLDAKLFAAFMGIYLAEGYCCSSDRYNIYVTQKNNWSRHFIWDEILSKFPQELIWTITKDRFHLADARLYYYLKKLGDQYVRYIPQDVKALDPECLNELIYWFCIGDGRMVKAAKECKIIAEDGKTFKEASAIQYRIENIPNARREVFTVSERLINDLHECLILAGRSGTLSKIITKKDYEYGGHIIKAEDKVPLHQLHISQTDYIWIDPRFINIEPIHHKGNIYCITTTHGNFYMRQNGKAFWTGNSDGTTKLRRVSHLITNVDIQDDGMIIGEALILPSTDNGRQLAAILKDGGKIGISSRGYGSVQPNEEGIDVVQDDFQLMTWDFVADPAATGSYPEFTTENKTNDIKIEIKETEDTTIMKNKVKTEALVPGKEDDIKKQEDQPRTQDQVTGPPQNPSSEEDEECEGCDDKMEALVSKIRKEEAEKAVAKLNELLKIREEEIKESIRSELQSDPQLAGAKMAMESVKKILRPYIIGEDISEEMGVKEKMIENLKQEMASKDVQITEYSATAKELGYKLRIEQKIADLPYKSEIRRLMGDVTRFESLKVLDKKLEGVLGQIKAYQNRFEAKEKEKDVVIKGLEEQVGSLKTMYKEAIRVAENFGIKAYMERKLAGHPASERIKKIVESRNLTTTEDVDSLVEQFNTVRTPGMNLRDKIRKRLNIKSESQTLVEDQVRGTLPRHKSEEILPGVTMDDIQKLSE
jgi:hypothetical protein